MTASPMRILSTGGRPSLAASLLPAAITAMAANSGLYLLGVMMGIFPRFAFAPAEGAMTLAPILFVSGVAVAAGFGVYALLRRRTADALRVFLPLALLVLLFSLAAPFLVPSWTAAEITLLNLMHIVAAGVTIGSLHPHVYRAERGCMAGYYPAPSRKRQIIVEAREHSGGSTSV